MKSSTLAGEFSDRVRFRSTVAFIAVIAAVALSGSDALFAQAKTLQIPAGAPLAVKLNQHVPMKVGEPLKCSLLYPVYSDNKLVVPAGSVVLGNVIALRDDRSRRIHARLSADFTPFHVPVVRFHGLVLPDGTSRPIVTKDTSNGAPVLHLATPAAKRSHSFIARQIDAIKQTGQNALHQFTAPGRKDRLVQFLYHQLPYHPQRIESGTAWTVTLAQPIELPPWSTPRNEHASTPGASSSQSNSQNKPVWHIAAYLEQTISSSDEKPGETFRAVVAEPIFKPDHTVAVPQGAILVGTITRATAARSFGRSGQLRFDFRELKFPNATSKRVLGSLAGVDADKSLQLDSEGGVQHKPKDRVIVPLALTILGGRALDTDGIFAANAAVASNGFGLMGRVVGIVAGSRPLAAGIGFWAAELSVYQRWLTHGKNVTFVKNTRIDVTAAPTRKPLTASASHGSL